MLHIITAGMSPKFSLSAAVKTIGVIDVTIATPKPTLTPIKTQISSSKGYSTHKAMTKITMTSVIIHIVEKEFLMVRKVQMKGSAYTKQNHQ